MNSALPFTAQIPELKINILAALWRAHPAPLGLSELYVNCNCEGLMTAYFLAITDMELAGWVRDASIAPFKAELTREGIAVIFSVARSRADKFQIAEAREFRAASAKKQRIPCMSALESSVADNAAANSDPWTAAHERVFGIKPVSGGDAAEPPSAGASQTQEPAESAGIHLVATARQQLLKAPEEAGEPCITCEIRTGRKCAQCDAPICRAHGYSAEGNEAGELCGDCRDAAQLEIEGIRTHGRADLGARE